MNYLFSFALVLCAYCFVSAQNEKENSEQEKKMIFADQLANNYLFSLGLHTSLAVTGPGADGVSYVDLGYPPMGFELGFNLVKISNGSFLSMNLLHMSTQFRKHLDNQDFDVTQNSRQISYRLGLAYNKLYAINSYSVIRLSGKINYVWARSRLIATLREVPSGRDFRFEREYSESENYFSPGLSLAYMIRVNARMAVELGLNYDVLIGDIPISRIHTFGPNDVFLGTAEFRNQLRHQLNLGLLDNWLEMG